MIGDGTQYKCAWWRFYFVIIAIGLLITALFGRMVQLSIVQRPFLMQQGDARTLRTISMPALRGMVTDRQGYPLAITTPVTSIWINPQEFVSNETNIQRVAKIIHEKPSIIRKRLAHNKNKEFIYIKRQLPPRQTDKVKALKIPGVHFLPEYRRYYPDGAVFAQAMGFTNIDDKGQEGIELEFDRWLAGKPGKERVLKDRLGHVVAVMDTIQKAEPGHKLQLSLDHHIQFLAYGALKKAVRENKAQSGSVVVMDVHSGEVLAMANYPSFNPNIRPKRSGSQYRNRAVTDVFEPGSTVKAFSVANALMSGKYTPHTKINTSPGWMMVAGNTVRDHRDYGTLDVMSILQRSSNVGITKITLDTKPDSLWQLLHTVGLGERTGSGFPGEVSGSLYHHRIWAPFTLATLSFGYGLSVTSLQLAEAYSIIAADGVKYPVTLVKRTGDAQGKSVMNPKVARQVLSMMESVLQKGGTATRAKIPGYKVSGKTGTSRIVGPHGYEKNHHIAIFVGVAPASDPQLVVAVDIKDPKAGKFYGGLVAAPVFKTVMGGALRVLDIPPDDFGAEARV